MLVCTGLCEYYETYKTFSIYRTYEKYKQCTRCGHVVPKEEFPDSHCYCCNAKYRHRYPISIYTRRVSRSRKRDRKENTETESAHKTLEETVNKLRY